MKRTISFLFVLYLALATFCGTVAADVFEWGNVNGDWFTPSNWNPAGMPSSSDTVVIANGSVTLNSDVTVANITMDGGTLDGSGTLTITGQAVYNSGSMKGSGVTRIDATGSLSLTSQNTMHLTGRTLDCFANVIWTGSIGSLRIEDGGTFNNRGVMEIQSAGGIDRNGTGNRFNNFGTIRKTTSSGEFLIFNVPFHNTGVVEVNAGTLAFFESVEASSSGNWNIASGAVLRFTGAGEQGITLESGKSMTGAGTVRFSSSNVTLSGDGTYNISGTTELADGSATFNFPNATTANYAHNGGTFDGSGSFVITGAAQYGHGDIRGSGTTRIDATGSLSLTGFNTMHVTERTINCMADTVWTGPGVGLQLRDGATFNNHGVFDIQADVFANRDGTGNVFNNFGTVKKTAGTGEAGFFFFSFNNSGTVMAQAGVLNIATDGGSSGDWMVDTGATLRFGAGTHDITLGTMDSITGTGTVRFSGGTTTIAGSGAYNVTGTTEIDGGHAVFNLPSASTAGYTHNSGTFDGTGLFVITGAAQYGHGDVRGTGTTRIDATGSLALTGFNTMHITQRTFTCLADTVWTSPGVGLQLRNGATFNNHGVIDIQADVFANRDGVSNVFNNFGTVKKTAGTGETSFIFFPFNNSGTVMAESGTLNLHGGGTSSGDFIAGTGATLKFGSETHDITLGMNNGFSGAGTVLFAGGTTTIDGTGSYDVTGSTEITGGSAVFNLPTATTAAYKHNGGTLDGAGLFVVTGAATYDQGDMRGTGTTRIDATGSLALTGFNTMHITGRTIDCRANTIWTGPAIGLRLQDGGVFNNHGVFDIQDDVFADRNGVGNAFNNFGTVKKSGGIGITGFFAMPFNNSGTLRSESGTLRISGQFTQDSGATELSTGILTADLDMNFTGGELTGAGGITANIVNSGATVRPGSSAGTMTITGNYTQSGTGSLALEIGGTTRDSQFDHLNITGTASLGGSLAISRINSFTPTPSDTFEFLSAASVTGVFETVTGTSSGSGGLFFDANYTAANASLDLKDGTPTVTASAVVHNAGQFSFLINGVAEQTYRVQASDDLLGWMDVETRTLSNGQWIFVDPNPDKLPIRFYRTLFLPQ